MSEEKLEYSKENEALLQREALKAKLSDAKAKYAAKAFDKDLKAWASEPANMVAFIKDMEKAVNRSEPFDLDKYLEEEKKNGICIKIM